MKKTGLAWLILITQLFTAMISPSIFASEYDITRVEKPHFDTPQPQQINIDAEKRLNLVKIDNLQDKPTPMYAIWGNIGTITGLMSEAYMFCVSAKEKIAFLNYNDMIKILDEELEKYKTEGGQTEFAEIISYEKKYVSNARVYTYNMAKAYFNENPLKVKTTLLKECSQKIDYEVEEYEDNTICKGKSKIIQQGKSGEKLVTEQISYINNEETSRNVINEEITIDPVAQIVAIGTGDDGEIVGTGEFSPPLRGKLTSAFGQRWGKFHGGVDIAAETGTPIYAADNGKVIFAQNCGSYGLLIKIDHANGYVTYYAHCSGFAADVGDYVTKGEKIAMVGNTGNSTGPHCHFEVRNNGKQLNPAEFIF